MRNIPTFALCEEAFARTATPVVTSADGTTVSAKARDACKWKG
jgi:hypothetical protein